MKPSPAFSQAYRTRAEYDDSWGVNDAPKKPEEPGTRPYRALPTPSAEWLVALKRS